MESLKITIPGDAPSKKNGKRAVKRGNRMFMIPNEKHEAWHNDTIHDLYKIARKLKKPIQSVLSVEMVIYPKTKRKSDLTNKAESVMDILVDAQILEDDNWFVVPHVVLTFKEVDRNNPRVELIIHYMDSDEMA